MRFVSLDHIIRNICYVQLQDVNLSQYVRVARAVQSAIITAELHFLPQINSALLEIDDNFIAVLPPGATVITKVGALASNGKIITLTKDNHLRRDQVQRLEDELEYCECDTPPEAVLVIPDGAEDRDVYHNVFWGGGFYGEMYSVPSTFDHAGTWRHNLEVGVLEMGAGYLVDTGCRILVEYKSVGENVNLIPVEAQEMIEAYAMYKLDFHRNPNKAQYDMNEFRRQARMLKRVYAAANPIDLTNSLMRGHKAVK